MCVCVSLRGTPNIAVLLLGSPLKPTPKQKQGSPQKGEPFKDLGASPFFPRILLFRKPEELKGKQLVFEKNDG